MQEDLMQEIYAMNHISTTWRDYCLFLLNSSSKVLRDNWREKLITSIVHSVFNYGIISEGNMAGLEVLTVLPDSFTQKVCNEKFSNGSWSKEHRIAGSKKMKIKIVHYPQESLSNSANICMKYIIQNWDEYGHLIEEVPLLKRMWDFSQTSKGNCLYPDEVLTYTLEKSLDVNSYGNWIDASIDVYKNGLPGNTFRKYYFCDKYLNWDKVNDKLKGFPFKEVESIEDQKYYFLKVCDVIFKEDITGCPSWKRVCICILKNDVSMKYAGFSMTYKERLAREKAMAAFDGIKKKNK